MTTTLTTPEEDAEFRKLALEEALMNHLQEGFGEGAVIIVCQGPLGGCDRTGDEAMKAMEENCSKCMRLVIGEAGKC